MEKWLYPGRTSNFATAGSLRSRVYEQAFAFGLNQGFQDYMGR